LSHAIWRNELVEDDVNALPELRRQPIPLATLSELHPATLAKSSRMQMIHRPAGIGDEMRVLLRADGTVWGKGSLYRAHDEAPFSAQERAFVGAIAPVMATALRRRLARRPTEPGDLIVPGVVTFDQADHPISGTKEANRLMSLIPGESATTLRTVAAQARIREEASLPVRLSDGRWLLVQGARMHGAGEATPEVAVTLMPAPRSIMLPVVLALHPLSAREREVAELLQRGLRTEEIAARLHISPHTLRDHIKSVFQKLEVNHRAELMALVGQYVAPDGDAGVD
jgi:DNA-binding CsgD family transcriptional regulator